MHISFIFSTLLLNFIALTFTQISKTWEYTIIHYGCETTDPSVCNVNAKLELIQRGTYGLTGVYVLSQTILDEHLRYELLIEYNSKRNSNYARTPFHIPTTNALDFLNGFYKKFLMDSLKDCSNAPQSSVGWKSYENLGNTYRFDKCLINTDAFPATLTPGFYRFRSIHYRLREPFANLTFELVVKLEMKF